MSVLTVPPLFLFLCRGGGGGASVLTVPPLFLFLCRGGCQSSLSLLYFYSCVVGGVSPHCPSSVSIPVSWGDVSPHCPSSVSIPVSWGMSALTVPPLFLFLCRVGCQSSLSLLCFYSWVVWGVSPHYPSSVSIPVSWRCQPSLSLLCFYSCVVWGVSPHYPSSVSIPVS